MRTGSTRLIHWNRIPPTWISMFFIDAQECDVDGEEKKGWSQQCGWHSLQTVVFSYFIIPSSKKAAVAIIFCFNEELITFYCETNTVSPSLRVILAQQRSAVIWDHRWNNNMKELKTTLKWRKVKENSLFHLKNPPSSNPYYWTTYVKCSHD